MAVHTRESSLDGNIVDAEGQVPKIGPKEAKLDEPKLEHAEGWRKVGVLIVGGPRGRFAYGMIFLSNEAFPLVFGTGNGGHGWTHSGTINLTFLAYVVGSLMNVHTIDTALEQANPTRKRGGGPPYGLRRLSPSDCSSLRGRGFDFMVWEAPLVGFACFGFGVYVIIAAILNYVVDGYGHYSASALGGVVFVRNIVGAIFPLFASQMFHRLDNQWSLTLLAFLSIFLVPIPFFLYYRGKVARAKSPYCAAHFGKDL